MNENGRKTKMLRGGLAAAGMAGALALGVAGCKSNNAPAPIVNGDGQNVAGQANGDPAAANLAPAYTGGSTGGYSSGNSGGSTTKVLSSSQSYAGQANGETYGYDQQPSAPIIRQAPSGSAGYDPNGPGYSDAEEAGEQALAETDQAPPPLPEYDQPPAPDPNYLWTPGYWNYAPTGYYWVPGAWCAPPFYGALWTPPYWGYGGSHYLFHRGYWGSHIGFYGGVDYGFGYIGTGYYGGYWRGRDFVYNRSVTNVNINIIHNVYERPVVFDGRQYGPHPMDRVSYDGGRGGLNVQPRPEELAAMHEAHYPPVAAQRDARIAAASNRGQFFSANAGRPAQAFAAHPVGSRENIAATPQGQPFNRTSAVNAGVRPGVPAAQPGLGQHPGGVPEHPGNQPAFGQQRPGNQPAFGQQHPGTQPGFGQQQRPGTTATQPGVGQARPGASNAQEARPGFGAQHPQAQPQSQRVAPQIQQRSTPQIQQRSTPQIQQQRPAPQIQQRPAPQVQQQRPAPAVQNRPEIARPQVAAPAPRPQAAPAARPAPAPAPHAAPPAPHGGGGEHGGHH